jgi:hypothetical protein
MKNIQRNETQFQIFSENFIGALVMLAAIELLVLTLVFGGAR